MSKFACTCGNRIGFNVYPSRYDGRVFRDQGNDDFDVNMAQEVVEFMNCVADGSRVEWLKAFYGESFDAILPIKDAEVVSDIISRHRSEFVLCIHQCERCSQLWLEKAEPNTYTAYLPEGSWRGALEKPDEGFVCYLDGQDYYNAVIAEIKQEGDIVRVVLTRADTGNQVVTFAGVSTIQRFTSEDRHVRFLSEWTDTLPLRRFVFDRVSQSSERLLEIIALEVHLNR